MQEPNARQRACREFILEANETGGRDFPIKNLTLAEVQNVLEWLDANRPGWDKNFWFKGLGKMDIDLGWDVFMPAVSQVLPQCVKHGFSPREVPAIKDRKETRLARPMKARGEGTSEFLVQGSAPEPYVVSFRRRGAWTFQLIACPAGQRMVCKHRIRILRGSTEGIVSKNTADAATVAGWLAGSDVETALQRVDELQKEADRINKALSTAKKALAQCLLD